MRRFSRRARAMICRAIEPRGHRERRPQEAAGRFGRTAGVLRLNPRPHRARLYSEHRKHRPSHRSWRRGLLQMKGWRRGKKKKKGGGGGGEEKKESKRKTHTQT